MKPWQTIKSRNIIEDLPWLKISVEHILLPNGEEIDNFYQVHLPEYAVTVAQTQEGLIIMERQYKHAVSKIILNLPAGYLNPNESPLACAQRELLEETGFKAENWYHLGSFVVDGNRGCGKVHAFIALEAYYVQEPHTDESENIDIILIDPKEACQSLLNGRIVTLGPAIALALAFLSFSSHLSANASPINVHSPCK